MQSSVRCLHVVCMKNMDHKCFCVSPTLHDVFCDVCKDNTPTTCMHVYGFLFTHPHPLNYCTAKSVSLFTFLLFLFVNSLCMLTTVWSSFVCLFVWCIILVCLFLSFAPFSFYWRLILLIFGFPLKSVTYLQHSCLMNNGRERVTVIIFIRRFHFDLLLLPPI